MTERVDDGYRLKGFDELSADEVRALVVLCQQKVDQYVEKRGERIWSHRTKSEGYISGTLRLKRAKSRCELCGIPHDEKALGFDTPDLKEAKSLLDKLA